MTRSRGQQGSLHTHAACTCTQPAHTCSLHSRALSCTATQACVVDGCAWWLSAAEVAAGVVALLGCVSCSNMWQQLKPVGALPPARKMHSMVQVNVTQGRATPFSLYESSTSAWDQLFRSLQPSVNQLRNTRCRHSLGHSLTHSHTYLHPPLYTHTSGRWASRWCCLVGSLTAGR